MRTSGSSTATTRTKQIAACILTFHACYYPADSGSLANTGEAAQRVACQLDDEEHADHKHSEDHDAELARQLYAQERDALQRQHALEQQACTLLAMLHRLHCAASGKKGSCAGKLSVTAAHKACTESARLLRHAFPHMRLQTSGHWPAAQIT